ncbi:MAG: hypothetical protein DDT42_02006 [candidate division WS2 bacterium]|uniref:IS1182 family transposase n=1 Tax=Psychracetigena formicireducens TaxID=2986056 RepID=A0A9E2BNA9_PSYF1|nr:hypothetical protein [Candidatus Psychracetigena formicireducens]
MKYIEGTSRDQLCLFPVSINSAISQDNEVRVIDLFIESLSLKDFGFRVDFGENGRPAYHPKDLLKLYIYGYMNKVRSSRDFEKECRRNLEVMWLLKQLQPDHNTISNFRRDNSESIRKVFNETVRIAKYFDLIGKKLLAGDSTKLRAQNSKKNNYNKKKIDRHLEYIENKLNQYNQILAKEDCDKPEEIKQEINKQLNRKEKYKDLEKKLQESQQEQISTSDSESRQMITRNNITEVAYNAQVSTDAKHCIPVDYKVTNSNDSKAMSEMVNRAAEIYETTDFTALYDKGYHTGSEIKKVQDMGVNLLVAVPDVSSNAPDKSYNVCNFSYDKEQDTYRCPQGEELHTNGKWYNKNRGDNREIIRIKQYKTKACKTCAVREKCTTSTTNSRVIERSEFAEHIEKNRQNVEENQHLYKRRQSIVEHPFGTIKRQWGFNYIITKQGIQRASSDVGFMLTAYNLRRIITILGIEVFKHYLQGICLLFSTVSDLFKLKISHFKTTHFIIKVFSIHFDYSPYELKFNQNLRLNGGF